MQLPQYLLNTLYSIQNLLNTLYLGSTFYTNLLYLEAKLPGIRWRCSLRDVTSGRKKLKRKWSCGEVEEGATSCPKMIVVCVDYSKICHLWAKHGLEDVQCYLLVVGSLPVAVWELCDCEMCIQNKKIDLSYHKGYVYTCENDHQFQECSTFLGKVHRQV